MFLFGAGELYATPKQDAYGAAIANPTPLNFGTLQEVSGDISFETKLLHGNKQFAVAAGRGKGKAAFKAKFADIDAAAFNLLFGVTPSAGIKAVVSGFVGSVPGTPFQITVAPPNSGTFAADLGVKYTATGLALTRVGSAPSVGQYTVSALGVYLFNTGDQGTNNVAISYEYTAVSTTAQYGTISNMLMGYAPSFSIVLSNPFDGKTFTLHLNKCISNKLSLPFKNEDYAVPDFDFDALADASGELGYWSLK